MKPAEIASYVLQHDARNLRLKRRLAEQGIDGRGEYQVTCRFRAATRGQASELARELRQKGFAAEMTPGRGGLGGQVLEGRRPAAAIAGRGGEPRIYGRDGALGGSAGLLLRRLGSASHGPGTMKQPSA